MKFVSLLRLDGSPGVSFSKCSHMVAFFKCGIDKSWTTGDYSQQVFRRIRGMARRGRAVRRFPIPWVPGARTRRCSNPVGRCFLERRVWAEPSRSTGRPGARTVDSTPPDRIRNLPGTPKTAGQRRAPTVRRPLCRPRTGTAHPTRHQPPADVSLLLAAHTAPNRYPAMFVAAASHLTKSTSIRCPSRPIPATATPDCHDSISRAASFANVLPLSDSSAVTPRPPDAYRDTSESRRLNQGCCRKCKD